MSTKKQRGSLADVELVLLMKDDWLLIMGLLGLRELQPSEYQALREVYVKTGSSTRFPRGSRPVEFRLRGRLPVRSLMSSHRRFKLEAGH